MSSRTATVERSGRSAVVRLHGEVAIATAGEVYGQLRAVSRRRDVREVVLDFSDVARVDSAGVAVISLATRQLERAGKKLELRELAEHHRAALDLLARPSALPPEEPPPEPPGALELVGDRVLGTASGGRALAALAAETVRQALAVSVGKRRLPAGSLVRQVIEMGVEGLFIVGLLSFLLGMTTAFQGTVYLAKFGAGPFVADMIGLSMVRELAPLMTAVILTGRTGAAIAAELGTMKVRSEVDALATMGINPVRFLVVPRVAAITFVGPALTLMAMFIGIAGGMFVAELSLDLSPAAFWERLAERLDLADYAHGLSKSLVFAWIIGFAGCHLGLRAGGDANSVGQATTRTVVSSIFFIILVDALFATGSTILRQS